MRLQLAHAVYEVARRESPYAPMSSPLGSGNLLLRSFDRIHIGKGVPETISMRVVLLRMVHDGGTISSLEVRLGG